MMIQPYIQSYFQALVHLTSEMAPYLLLGFLFAGILHVFFPEGKINRMLGKNNFQSVLNASLLGIPLPLCSCGVIPTGISFHRHGASKGSTVSFLISTPQTGVDSILVTYSLIGLPFAILRVIIALVTGLIGGMVTNVFTKNDQENSWFTERSNERISTEIKGLQKLLEMLRYAFVEFIEDIAKWLIIGLLIAALIAVVIPDDFFSAYIKHEILGMLVILLASIPLYICATGSVPIAAVLLMKGISPGAALVFLMAGPATNAATITVIGKALGRKTLFSYLASIIGGAIIFGMLTDFLLPRDLLTNMLSQIEHGIHHHEVLPGWLHISSAIILGFFLIIALLPGKFKRFLLKRNYEQDRQTSVNFNHMTQYNIIVKGMTCNHCKATVENNLSSITGINNPDADIEKNTVTFSGENIDLNKVKQTIEGLGYVYEGIR